MTPPSIEIDKIVGKHVTSVRSSKDDDALRVDMAFKEGGTLTIRLSRPQDWGWKGMLARRPHEVCMKWRESGGVVVYVCHDDSTEEQRLASIWEGRRFENVADEDGQWQLILDDEPWIPSIYWITGQSKDDNVPTVVQLAYSE